MYCFRLFATGMYETNYLDMQHFGTGHFFFVLTRFFARCTLEASLQIFWNSIDSFSQTLDWAQLTEDITKYKHAPFFLNFFKKSNVTTMSSVSSSYIFFKDISCYPIENEHNTDQSLDNHDNEIHEILTWFHFRPVFSLYSNVLIFNTSRCKNQSYWFSPRRDVEIG